MKCSNKIWKHYTLISLSLLSHLLQTEVHPYTEHCCLLTHMFWHLLRQVKTDPPTHPRRGISVRALTEVWPSVAGCHLQPLREAKLPYWPFTAPANWDHASSSAAHDALARLGHSHDGWRKSNVARWGRSFLRGRELGLCSCCLHNFRGTAFRNMCRALICYLRGSMVVSLQ